MYAVREAGDGYIVSKSLGKTDRRERAWATNPKGYTAVSADFRHKSRIVKRTVTDERGDKHVIQEKVVVYWGRAFHERERNEKYHGLTQIEDQFREMKIIMKTACGSPSSLLGENAFFKNQSGKVGRRSSSASA